MQPTALTSQEQSQPLPIYAKHDMSEGINKLFQNLNPNTAGPDEIQPKVHMLKELAPIIPPVLYVISTTWLSTHTVPND